MLINAVNRSNMVKLIKILPIYMADTDDDRLNCSCINFGANVANPANTLPVIKQKGINRLHVITTNKIPVSMFKSLQKNVLLNELKYCTKSLNSFNILFSTLSTKRNNTTQKTFKTRQLHEIRRHK